MTTRAIAGNPWGPELQASVREPQATGAKVRDRDGDEWIRAVDGRWWHPSGMKWAWGPIMENFGPLTLVNR